MLNSTRVSVITVSLNSEEFIEEAIKSVLNQDYLNIEYIVVDGLSNDRTMEIVKSYEPLFNGRLKWISEFDRGIYDAMNKGIKMVTGSIIGILNSDDFYERDTVSTVVNRLADFDMAHGNMCIVDKDGVKLKTYSHKKGFIRKYLSTPFNHPTMFLKREVYDMLGLFNPEYSIAGDYDFMLRFYESNFKDLYLDKVLTNFRTVGITSQTSGIAGANEIYKVLVDNKVNPVFASIFLKYRYIRSYLHKLLAGSEIARKIYRTLSSYHR